MYKKINQIGVGDEKLNLYAIFNEHSKKYLYDLFVINNKVLKKLYITEIIKISCIVLGLLTWYSLVTVSIVHTFTTNVMSTNAGIAMLYITFWCFAIPGLFYTFFPAMWCLHSFLTLFKEENFVNNVESVKSEAKIGGKRIHMFSHLEDYSSKFDNRDKTFSFVEYLQSLKVSELEKIFHNDSKMHALINENNKIKSILDTNQYIDTFKNDLQNKMKKNDEKIEACAILLNEYDKAIEEHYKNSLKKQAEKEMLDLLAS